MRGGLLALATVLGACSGTGTQGPPGPAGPAGGAGNADPAQVVVLGTAPQAGSFHVTGPAYVGSLETSRVTFGASPAEALDAAAVAALTGGSSADALHTHAASALSGTLPASALPPEAALLVSGKVPASVLPASVPLLEAGRLPAAVLPASVPLLDGSGKLPASAMPADYAQAASVYSKAESDARYAPQSDVSALATQLAALQSGEATRTATQQSGAVSPGQCVTLTHGWNTTAVSVSAWERRAGRTLFVRWAEWHDDGTTDAARGAVLAAAPAGGTVALANDGNPATQWEAASGLASLTLDLGRLRKIDEVRIRPSRTGSPDSTTSVWLETSHDGATWIASGTGMPVTCVMGSTCDQLLVIPVGRVGRHVRLNLQGVIVATVADVEVYGEGATLYAHASGVTACNYDPFTKELSLRVSR